MRLRHKFNAVATICDGIRFPSKKEAARYAHLKTLKESGDVIFFLRQVPFHITPDLRYVCDFMVFWSSGEITFEDVKGMKTDTYVAKKKMVEHIYPIKIDEI